MGYPAGYDKLFSDAQIAGTVLAVIAIFFGFMIDLIKTTGEPWSWLVAGVTGIVTLFVVLPLVPPLLFGTMAFIETRNNPWLSPIAGKLVLKGDDPITHFGIFVVFGSFFLLVIGYLVEVMLESLVNFNFAIVPLVFVMLFVLYCFNVIRKTGSGIKYVI